MQKMPLPSIETIQKQFPNFSFEEDDTFHWSPRLQTIFYNSKQIKSTEGFHQLLHEIGHATSGHKNYTSGIQLIRLETEAWSRAKEIASDYGLTIDQTKIENCLDSYRDWLHLRSACPSCETIAAEVQSNRYRCFACLNEWTVPADQRTRKYRLKQFK